MGSCFRKLAVKRERGKWLGERKGEEELYLRMEKLRRGWLKIRIQKGEDKTARERKTRLSQAQSGDGRQERH